MIMSDSGGQKQRKLDQNGQDAPKRRRIAKACDYCRKKKIKCDGQTPCTNCNTNSVECYYAATESKKPIRRPNSNARTLKDVDAKINRLEALMYTMLERINSGSGPAITSRRRKHVHKRISSKKAEREKQPGHNTSNITDSDTDGALRRMTNGYGSNAIEDNDDMDGVYDMYDVNSDDIDDYSEDLQSEDNSDTFEDEDYDESDVSQDNGTAKVENSNNGNDGKNNISQNPQEEGQLRSSLVLDQVQEFPDSYYTRISAHDYSSVFSSTGLNWIQSKLGKNGPTDVYYLKRSIHKGHVEFRNAFQRLVEAKEPHDKSFMPNDEVFVYIFHFFCQTELLDFVVDADDAKNLINKYLDARRRKDYSKLLNSDYLILCMVLVMTCALFPTSPHIVEIQKKLGMNLAELYDFEKRYFAYALYFFHKIALIGENINAVKGGLLLAFYADARLLSNNYMVVASAIRFAQELGLHRVDSYRGLPPKEALKRRLLWAILYILDKENNMKLGQPPVIHEKECTTMTPSDFKSQMLKNFPAHFTIKDTELNEAFVKALDGFAKKDHKGFIYLVIFLQLGLAAIGSKCYEELLSGTAVMAKKSFTAATVRKVVKRIRKLSNELEKWKRIAPEFMHCDELEGFLVATADYPYSHEAQFRMRKCFVVALYCIYNYDLMVIHRIAYSILWKYGGGNSKLKGGPSDYSLKMKLARDTLTSRCLDSAVTLLKLSVKFDEAFLEMRNSFAVFVLAAFFTLFTSTAAYPEKKESLAHIRYMIQAFEKFFCGFDLSTEFNNITRFLFCKLILISIKLHKIYSQDPDFAETDPVVASFLEKNLQFTEAYADELGPKNQKTASRTSAVADPATASANASKPLGLCGKPLISHTRSTLNVANGNSNNNRNTRPMGPTEYGRADINGGQTLSHTSSSANDNGGNINLISAPISEAIQHANIDNKFAQYNVPSYPPTGLENPSLAPLLSNFSVTQNGELNHNQNPNPNPQQQVSPYSNNPLTSDDLTTGLGNIYGDGFNNDNSISLEGQGMFFDNSSLLSQAIFNAPAFLFDDSNQENFFKSADPQ